MGISDNFVMGNLELFSTPAFFQSLYTIDERKWEKNSTVSDETLTVVRDTVYGKCISLFGEASKIPNIENRIGKKACIFAQALDLAGYLAQDSVDGLYPYGEGPVKYDDITAIEIELDNTVDLLCETFRQRIERGIFDQVTDALYGDIVSLREESLLSYGARLKVKGIDPFIEETVASQLRNIKGNIGDVLQLGESQQESRIGQALRRDVYEPLEFVYQLALLREYSFELAGIEDCRLKCNPLMNEVIRSVAEIDEGLSEVPYHTKWENVLVERYLSGN